MKATRMRLPLLMAGWAAAAASQVWTVRVEEPTGLYRRTDEVAVVPLGKLGGGRAGYTVTDARGREAPHQVSGGELLFPVSVMPGELPEYTVRCCAAAGAPYENQIVLRQVGLRRVEFGNAYFRAVIDTGLGAIVEAYSLRAPEHRRLNLVETTPESREALKGDIHGEAGEKAIPPAVAGVEGENEGWTTLGGRGGFEKVELVERGPLRGRLRLTRAGEMWEITFQTSSAGFVWKGGTGFRFASLSAWPYEPFNRCVGGSEYEWPAGPGESEPEPNGIGPRAWKKLPGGHVVYYRREEDYGALGIVALDGELEWAGVGTRRLVGRKAAGMAAVAVTFPRWKGKETVLEARREYRVLRQPVLVKVSAGGVGRVAERAARAPEVVVGNGAAAAFPADAVALDGEWELMWAEKGEGPPAAGWRKVRAPGTVHVQWLEAKQIYSREAEWISGKEWWYRRAFRLPARFRGKRLRLEFEATDYYADVFLNGKWLGRHEGYIDAYEYDITGQARVGGENRIEVRVWTPVSYYWKHRPYTVKGAYGAVDQKPDDITALGITRSVRVTAGEAARITDVAVNTRLEGSGARVEVDLAARDAGAGYRWQVTLTPRNFEGERIQVTSEMAARVTAPVANPQLWWTWDHGRPNLYTLEVRLLDEAGRAVDGRTMAVGIREIEKIGWNFYLNRRKLFIRGTNYYDHLYMAEMTREKYARDMDLMVGMNVNMIRAHCHFSNPEFYDLADERGVLVWQDFLEAWYPHDRGFAQRAAELYDNHIRHVRNHASVALWATSDEEDFGNYTEITKHLAPRAYFLDPQRRPVVRSTGRFGDSHVYHGWYDGSIWDYTTMTEDFVSELGATSLPNYETLRTFLGDKWPIGEHVEEWQWRRLQVKEAIRAWGDPAGMTMEQYVPKTQAYAARLFQIALERMRRRKGEGAGGILHFHAIDIWPSVTMAAIDFERRPTKVYETVRRSFAPVAALFEYDRDQWKEGEEFRCGLWGVNDGWAEVSGAELRWKIVGPGGAEARSGAMPVRLGADAAVKAGVVEWAAGAPGCYELRASVVDGQGKEISENIYEFEVVSR